MYPVFLSGFVGAGMLSAAVSGAVFASPPPSEIEEALLQIGQGCLGKSLMTCLKINFTINQLSLKLECCTQA